MLFSSKACNSSSTSPTSYSKGGDTVESRIERYRKEFTERYKNEPEFLQAHGEIFESLIPVFLKDPRYLSVFEIVSEPERVVQFRVLWQDDNGEIQCNRGYRVQYNSALGPYKGGLRLHPSVNLSVLKFLGFEQIFKNSLTGLHMGGGKGGSDFDPKGKSDMEVRSFCQSFMTELFRHIGPETDVPAGDIGTGGREIGFMYGQYHRLTNRHHGVLTGKGIHWGGSYIRPEATGYGAVYFAQELFKHFGTGADASMTNKKCLVSGSGNAAQYTCEKLLELGAKVLSVSDTSGSLYFKEGMSVEDLKAIMEMKNERRGRLSELNCRGQYFHSMQPWMIEEADCDIAFPAATQNELTKAAVESLLKKPSFRAVVEVSNMSTTPEGIALLKSAASKPYYCPGKAANAGGVAVSGLEMSQNASMTQWSTEEVDRKLRDIMSNIFSQCVKRAAEYTSDPSDLQAGANIAGFLKVADAMLEQGLY